VFCQPSRQTTSSCWRAGRSWCKAMLLSSCDVLLQVWCVGPHAPTSQAAFSLASTAGLRQQQPLPFLQLRVVKCFVPGRGSPGGLPGCFRSGLLLSAVQAVMAVLDAVCQLPVVRRGPVSQDGPCERAAAASNSVTGGLACGGRWAAGARQVVPLLLPSCLRFHGNNAGSATSSDCIASQISAHAFAASTRAPPPAAVAAPVTPAAT
jgi:hypothetical protein